MRRQSWFAAILFVSAQACTTAGGCGSQNGSKIAGGFNPAYVQGEAIQARFSPTGFKYIEDNLMPIVQAVLGHPLQFTLPPLALGTTGYTFCAGGGCSADINVVPGSLKITRGAPDGSGKSKLQVAAKISAEIDNIYTSADGTCKVDFRFVNHYRDACLSSGQSFGGDMASACNSFCAANSDGQGRDISLAISVGTDPILGYPTVSVDSVDLALQASNGCSAVQDIRPLMPYQTVLPCDAAHTTDCCPTNLSTGQSNACIAYYDSMMKDASALCLSASIINDVLSGFEDTIKDAAVIAINQQIAAKLIMPCVTDSDCSHGLTCNQVQVAGGYPADCVGAKCLLPPVFAQACNANGTAVPPLMGMEAEEDVASLAGASLPSGALYGTAGPLKFTAGIGGSLGNDSDADLAARGVPVTDDERGLTIAGFVGIDSAQSNCVPPQPRPPPVGHQPLQLPDQISVFDTAAKQMVSKDYAASMSLSRDVLNQLAWGVYTNGDMCLTFSGTKTLQIDSQLLSLIVQSLGTLEENQNEPAFINVYPEEVPVFSAGAGELTYAADGTPTVKTPHLQIDVHKLNLEFYAFVEDRYVRLFTLKVDFSAGVFFDFDAQGNFLPVLSDLQQGLGQIAINNVDILGDRVQSLQTLLPAILSFALPTVTSALLKPLPLPLSKLLPGYAFEVVGLHGTAPIAGTDTFDYLSVFGAMTTAPLTRDATPVPVDFTLGAVRVETPVGPLLDAATAPIVHVPTLDRSLEYSYRLDDGLFSPFASTKEITVSRPVLRIAATHTLDVMARKIGDRRSLSATQRVSFEVKAGAENNTGNAVPVHAHGCNVAGSEVAWLVSLALFFVRRRQIKPR